MDLQELMVINNPFKTEYLNEVHIHFLSGRWVGTVVFKNGNTKGEQSTGWQQKFEDVVYMLKTIGEQVSRK